MRQRYFLIEPKYSDPDTFCHFVVGSDRVCASIQIYADLWMLRAVATALTAPSLEEEFLGTIVGVPCGTGETHRPRAVRSSNACRFSRPLRLL